MFASHNVFADFISASKGKRKVNALFRLTTKSCLAKVK